MDCYEYYDFVFMISLQFNEVVAGELGTTLLFQMCFYTLFIVVIFICTFITYKMTYSLLQVRKEEIKSYVAENRNVLCVLCQEQLFIYGAAFVLD